MTYEEFCTELLEKLKQKQQELGYDKIEYFEDGFTSKDSEELATIRSLNIRYNKNESDILQGDFIFLHVEGKYSEISRFSCKLLYDYYKQGEWDYVWEAFRSNLEMCRKYEKLGIIDLMNKNDYELLKEKIFVRPLNFTDHRYELKDCVFRRIGDIVLVLYVLANDENIGEQHNVMSMKLPRHMMEQWNMSEDEVWENAMINTYIMAPPRMYIQPMDAYKPSYSKGAFMALNSDIKSLSPMDIPVITTTMQINGAIAIFYPGVKERIAELFGSDYYVAFTSIHDIRVHKKGIMSPRSILNSIKDTNKAFDPSEILSRKVYLYDTATKELKQLEL